MELEFRAIYKREFGEGGVFEVNEIEWMKDGSFILNGEIPGGAVELLKYTGFKDSKGVKIFQGHIVATPTHYNQEVVWDAQRGMWALDGVDHPSGQLSHFAAESEVVGDKYSHPELLDAQNN